MALFDTDSYQVQYQLAPTVTLRVTEVGKQCCSHPGSWDEVRDEPIA